MATSDCVATRLNSTPNSTPDSTRSPPPHPHRRRHPPPPPQSLCRVESGVEFGVELSWRGGEGVRPPCRVWSRVWSRVELASRISLLKCPDLNTAECPKMGGGYQLPSTIAEKRGVPAALSTNATNKRTPLERGVFYQLFQGHGRRRWWGRYQLPFTIAEKRGVPAALSTKGFDQGI